MRLCLDVGNTTIHGGVFDDKQLKLHFRKTSEVRISSDELGLFLRSVLRENRIDPGQVKQIGICSVVPPLLHAIRNACYKYFDTEPFVLQAGTRTGLKIKYRNPAEVGADRIANAIAGVDRFPDQNLVIVDFGTATTFCAVSRQQAYLGGAILPGFALSMEALESRTAKLPSVEILDPGKAIGRSTEESIQAGLYCSQVGTVREVVKRFADEAFADQAPVVIGTGGYSRLFEKEQLFDAIVPNLVLDGLRIAYDLN